MTKVKNKDFKNRNNLMVSILLSIFFRVKGQQDVNIKKTREELI